MKDFRARLWTGIWQWRGRRSGYIARGGHASLAGVEAIARSLRESLALAAGSRLLDLGCGAGNMMNRLAPPGRSVGLDRSLPALQCGREQFPASGFVCGDICALPFRPGAFDRVLCNSALMYLPATTLPGILAEIRRTLAPAGCALLGQLLDRAPCRRLFDLRGFVFSWRHLPGIIMKKAAFLSGSLTLHSPEEIKRAAQAAGFACSVFRAASSNRLYRPGVLHFNVVLRKPDHA